MVLEFEVSIAEQVVETESAVAIAEVENWKGLESAAVLLAE